MKVLALRHCSLLIGVIFAGATLVAPSPATAFELFGIHLWGEKKADEADETIGEPQDYTVDFIVTGEERNVEKTLKGASGLWTDRKKPASGAAGLLAKARSDYRRLLAALYGQGRYGGTISILVDGREAADLPPDATVAETASVSITVNPGPVFLFDKASIINRAPPPQRRDDRVPLPEDEGFAMGQPARSGVILQAEKLSVEAWREQGHPKANIADRRVTAAHDNNTVDAIIEVDPGRKAYYDDVAVEGTERMDPAFVAWMTGLKPGQEYDPDDIDRANKRLSRLDVFRALRIQEGDVIDQNGRLPLTVVVQERKLRRFGVGGSYSTLDGLGLEAYWLHRNLFGRAERLRFDAKVANIGQTFEPDELTYRVGATFIKPGVYTPDTDFEASLFGDREVLDPYTRTAVTGQLGFNHMFSEELSGKLFLKGGYAQFEDDTFGTRDFADIGFLGGLTFDNRDNKTDATQGYFVEAIAEPFYEFNYGNAVGKLTAEGRTYYGFGKENPVVLAGRVKLGTLFGAPISETAPDKLFFAGGGGSVRGYAYRNIGVVTPAGEVIGGRSLIEASAEIRARVTDGIGLVAFVDAGYVGEESFPDFAEDLRVGVGGGLRYYTGLGPIRLDLAVPLDRQRDDPSVAFYVGIGQAF
ncbi:autotransporter secretion outer membrane protein TamA [Mesorhizobium albiziae]|uniref:Autotransporter secretion outer membrane protein TamA n=1 Tax=Neomesorhizobium albiziae TaxID=335020 RepID=A0A1I4BVQ0_9HYPH|nr:membrane protein [Mesorhizobium albiziae]SFK72066.1 autotransporter secretion outer membrane protein TamA [Mesorhizobium albiziae]